MDDQSRRSSALSNTPRTSAPEGSDSPVSNEFIELYKKTFADKPNAFAALGFDAYNMLLDCIERAGEPSPEKIRDEIARIKDYPGVTGVMTIDANGNADKSAVLLEVKNGDFQYLMTIRP